MPEYNCKINNKNDNPNKVIIGSNINDVIRAVLNFLLFFYEKILHIQKSIKSTKRIKSKKTQKRNQAKVQNANKRTKIKYALKKHLRGKK